MLNGFSGGVPRDFMARMATLNTLPDAGAVRLLTELGVDVVAVHRGEPGKSALRDFFGRQTWATVSDLPTGEFVVLIDRGTRRSD